MVLCWLGIKDDKWLQQIIYELIKKYRFFFLFFFLSFIYFVSFNVIFCVNQDMIFMTNIRHFSLFNLPRMQTLLPYFVSFHSFFFFFFFEWTNNIVSVFLMLFVNKTNSILQMMRIAFVSMKVENVRKSWVRWNKKIEI